MEREQFNKFGDVKVTKHYIVVFDKTLKKAIVTKRCVHLQDGDKEYSDKMRVYSKEEVIKRHMGKMKCVVKYKDQQDLMRILDLYFL